MHKTLSLLVITIWLLAMATAPAQSTEPQPRRPNVVFVLADDLGIANLGCYGGDHVQTPNLDALAKGGTRYTRAFTVPLCGPSRALLLTGRYGFRTGAVNQDQTGEIDPARETFLPKVLKAAGYATASIGKWGQLPKGPGEAGFDDYLRYSGSGVYWNTQERGKTYIVNGEKRPLLDQQYMPDVMHAHLVEFMTKHRSEPFFVYYSLSHVHSDILPTPDSAPDSKDLYADNLAYLDKLVGKLIAELERLQLRDDTLVVFMGDNGTAKAWAAGATIGGRRLAGEKGSMQEGGGLVPLIANWPGTTPAGKVSADLIDAADFFATFAELAAAKLPAGVQLDSHSFAPQLRGEPGQPRGWVFNQLAKMWYVRDAGWKLNQAGELYDMSGAPFVEQLVPADSTEPVAKAARVRLQQVLAELDPAAGIQDQGDGTGRHRRNAK